MSFEIAVKYLYRVSSTKESAIVVDRHYAVSFITPHLAMQIGDEVILEDVKSPDGNVKTTVYATGHDCIAFKINEGEFPQYPPFPYHVFCGQKYIMVGYNKEEEKPIVECGRIQPSDSYYILGSTSSPPGSGIFDENGMTLGIVTGNQSDGRCIIFPTYALCSLYTPPPPYSW